MVTRLPLILGALAAALGAGWLIYHLTTRNAALRADLRGTEATIENYREAARVANDQLRAEQARNAALEARIDEFAGLEGADDALSDYGRAVLDSVR